MIRVAMTSELSWQRNEAIIYFISVLRTVLPKSFTGAFSINNRLDVREANKKTKSMGAVSRYFGWSFYG